MGGDSGDLGLSKTTRGEVDREHVKDAVAGLDGGLSGSGREAALPADCLFDPVERFVRREDECVYEWLPSFLDSPGGVGGRSPVSSYENEVFP